MAKKTVKIGGVALTRPQLAMLLRTDVRQGTFWPDGRVEWMTYRALERRGLMAERTWDKNEDARITCKALTGKGMGIVVGAVAEKRT